MQGHGLFKKKLKCYKLFVCVSVCVCVLKVTPAAGPTEV